MTCIVATRHAIAGERMCSKDDGTRFLSETKLWRHGAAIYGAAGGAEDCRAFRAWVERAGAPDDLGELNEGFEALRVDASGIAFCGVAGHWLPVDSAYFAIGAGSDVALGAMHRAGEHHDVAGVNLEHAIAAAIYWKDSCGGQIDLLELAP